MSRVHERLDEKPESLRLVQLALLEQIAERFGFAAARQPVFQFAAHFRAEHLRPARAVHAGAHRAHCSAGLEQGPDGGAIGIAARQRREILEAQPAVRLPHGGGVKGCFGGPASRQSQTFCS